MGDTDTPSLFPGKIAVQLSLMCALQACGPIADSSGTASSATDQETLAGQATTQTAIFVAAGTVAPECTTTIAQQIAYFESESAFKYCTGKAWQSVDLRGPQGLPGGTGATLVTSSQEAAGANCLYGGAKFSLGADADSNSNLDPQEVTGTFYHCESSISAIASTVMTNYFFSIGLVQSIYRFTGTCYGTNKTHERGASGTTWAYSADTFVTNAHVAEASISEDCNSDGTDDTTFNLAEIRIYLPKTSIPLSTWLTKGPTYSPTHASQTEYDVLTVTHLDRRPSAATAPTEPTDISDAMFLKISAHGRTPIAVSTASQDSPGPKSVRIGEQLVLIAHPAARSSTMSTGSLMSMQSCAEWWQTDSSLLSIYLTESEFCKIFQNVPTSRRMITSNYNDHGSSGGPVFNRFGEVTGLLTWGGIADEESDYSAVQQLAYVRPWLEMTRVWASVLTPTTTTSTTTTTTTTTTTSTAWQNVTVTDSSYKQTLTGKEWTKIQGTYTWYDAVIRCGDPTNKWGSGIKSGTINTYPGYNGKRDWRMPSLGELRTAYSGVVSSLDGAAYYGSSLTTSPTPSPTSNGISSITNTQFLNGDSWSSFFLSGATDLGDTSKAIEIEFIYGWPYPWSKSLTDKVICVRGP